MPGENRHYLDEKANPTDVKDQAHSSATLTIPSEGFF